MKKLESVEHAHKLVSSVATVVREHLLKETEGLDPKERWLVIGRVFQYLWHEHFQISYKLAEEQLNFKVETGKK